MDASVNLSEEQKQRLRSNLSAIHQRMADAAQRGGRDPDAVRLVAVTKRTPLQVALALNDLGAAILAESRPEELCRKAQQISVPLSWHLIGPFQTKKIAKTLPHTELVHSVHSIRLGRDIAARVNRGGLKPKRILLQVNVCGEEAKQGLSPTHLESALEELSCLDDLMVCGLMTMAPKGASDIELREIFGALHAMRDNLGADRLPELSMGMSGDFEIAIEEGATLIRVGSALFEGMVFDS